MTENLRIVLLIVGVIAIAALLIHGIWSSRKERSSFFSDRNMSKQKKRNKNHNREDVDVIDNFGADNLNLDEVGDVKIVSTHAKKGEKALNNSDSANTHDSHELNSGDSPESVKSPNIHFDASGNSTQVVDDLDTQPHQPKDLTNQAPIEDMEPRDSELQTTEHVIIFHVVGLNDSLLRGDLLLNSFLNAGLHYGDMNIFHKHIGAANTPVLFSIANMVNPGTFEPSRMSEFTTPGVTCFMVLPTAGQPIQNFKMMLQTIQRIADDVGGVVWDNERRLITPQKIDEYRAGIREWMLQN